MADAPTVAEPVRLSKHLDPWTVAISALLLIGLAAGTENVTHNGPREAALWLPVYWLICGAALLWRLRRRAPQTPPERGKGAFW
jgi:hypothetical protein